MFDFGHLKFGKLDCPYFTVAWHRSLIHVRGIERRLKGEILFESAQKNESYSMSTTFYPVDHDTFSQYTLILGIWWLVENKLEIYALWYHLNLLILFLTGLFHAFSQELL